MVAKRHHCATSGTMSANTVVASNKSKCFPRMRANHYLRLLSPILFLIAFFAIIQVLLLTTAESSSSGTRVAHLNSTTTTTTTTPAPTRSPKWYEIWRDGDSFLQSSPEVLTQRSRRSQSTTTLAPQQVNSSTTLEVTTTSRPYNETKLQIRAPEMHVASESGKAIQVSTSSILEPQAESTNENVGRQEEDDELVASTSAPIVPQKETVKNDLVRNELDDRGYVPERLPATMDIGELVPGSFEGLVGADEDLGAATDNENQAKQLAESHQQPEASELVLDGHSNHIGPSLETIIHGDKAGDIRAQVGLSLHYKPSHSAAHSDDDDDEEPNDGTSLANTGGLAGVANDGEAIAGSNNEQQENYRTTQRRHKARRPEDIGRVIVGARRHNGLAHSARPKKQMTTADLSTAAGHYYGKKKKKKMIYKKKKIKKKKKKKIIIIKKKKKKKYMKKKKVKKYKVKKYKKKKIVIIKKKKRKAKKYHHHGHHYGHHGGHHGGGGHGKYYMYAKVPKKKSWEFGFKRGNKKHWIERHEKGHKNKFKTKVKWYDAKSKGKGIHVWDYNHHDKKKKKHYG